MYMMLVYSCIATLAFACTAPAIITTATTLENLGHIPGIIVVPTLAVLKHMWLLLLLCMTTSILATLLLAMTVIPPSKNIINIEVNQPVVMTD